MAAGRSPRARLLDMLEAAEGIRAAVHGLDFADFEKAWVVQRAVERGLEIISEASRHLPAETKAAYPDLPWRQTAGIGNVLRHDYQRVEPRLICGGVRGRTAPPAGVRGQRPRYAVTSIVVSPAASTRRNSRSGSATQPSVGAKSARATCRKIALPRPRCTGASFQPSTAITS